jgi:NADPH2:quinone reductase
MCCARGRTGWSGVRSGKVKVRIAKTFALADGAEAHRFLEGRGAIGKVLLLSGGIAR